MYHPEALWFLVYQLMFMIWLFFLNLYTASVHVNATKGFCPFVWQTQTDHYYLLLQTDKEYVKHYFILTCKENGVKVQLKGFKWKVKIHRLLFWVWCTEHLILIQAMCSLIWRFTFWMKVRRPHLTQTTTKMYSISHGNNISLALRHSLMLHQRSERI